MRMRSTPKRIFVVRGLSALSLMLALPIACSISMRGSGAPLPSSTPATSSSAVESTGQASQVPQRPKVLNMTKVAPCDLLSPEQRTSLGIPRVKERDLQSSRQCIFPGSQSSAFWYINVDANDVISNYDYNDSTRSARPVLVQGFNALVLSKVDDPVGCIVVIDVADGQLMKVQRDDRTGTPTDEICGSAQAISDMAMMNVLAK